MNPITFAHTNGSTAATGNAAEDFSLLIPTWPPSAILDEYNNSHHNHKNNESNNNDALTGTPTPPVPNADSQNLPDAQSQAEQPIKESSTTVATPSTTATRSSIPVACVSCRSRHLKCDGATRCSRCVSEDVNCVYLKSRRGWKGPRRTAKSTVKSSALNGAHASGMAGADINSAKRSTSKDSPNGLENSSHGLPSPPGAMTQHSAATPPMPLAPIGPMTPPAINDSSDKGLENAFYIYFHPTHPFLPPQHCLHLLESVQTSHLELAVRFVGSLYVPSARSHEYLHSFRQLMTSNALPMDGTRVQALLLFAIGLHMSDFEQESAEVMREVAQLACDLGMNRSEYATRYGNGQPVLEECWRRTWWEVFVCDGFFTGVNPMHYAMVLQGIKHDVFLPCEEGQFLMGQVPSVFQTLDDYDGAVFEEDVMVFSSATYRIDAVRLMHKVCPIQRLAQQTGVLDAELVAQADVHLTHWWLHLPPSKRAVMDKHGNVDEILFEAFMIAHACTIILHRPRSDLNTDEARGVTTCVSTSQRPLPTLHGSEIHTAKALKSAQEISALITLPCPLLKHTPFFSCAVVLASVVFLSYWSFILSPDGDTSIKDHIKLNIGVLKRQGEVWPIARTVLGQVRGVAAEIFQSRRAIMNMYLPQVTREEAFRGLVEESGRELGDQHLFGGMVQVGFGGAGDQSDMAEAGGVNVGALEAVPAYNQE